MFGQTTGGLKLGGGLGGGLGQGLNLGGGLGQQQQQQANSQQALTLLLPVSLKYFISSRVATEFRLGAAISG